MEHKAHGKIQENGDLVFTCNLCPCWERRYTKTEHGFVHANKPEESVEIEHRGTYSNIKSVGMCRRTLN